MKHQLWLKNETLLLKEVYPKMWVKDIVKMFPKRSKATIAIKALQLNLPSAKLWQPCENGIINKHFAESSKKELLQLLPKRSWVAILAQGERLNLRRKTNKPTLKVNELYFRKWSANMAYVLGFIFADGNITEVTKNGYSDKLGIGLNKKDIDVLEKIKKELSAKQTLSISGEYVHFSIFSQIIVDDLKKLGVTYRKSSCKELCKIPNIPKKYVKDFIRGVVDGDGSIHFNKKNYPTLSICGREEVMFFIRDYFLLKFKIYSKIIQPKKDGKLSNVFCIAYRCNSAKILINHLYKNSKIYLKRKYLLSKKCLKIKINKKNDRFSEEEKKTIVESFPKDSKEEILNKLPNRTWSSIQQKAYSLKIYKYKNNQKICV